MDMGNKEGRYNPQDKSVPIHIKNLRFVKHELEKKGYKEGKNLGYFEDEQGHHNERSWGNRFHFPMLFFFGK